MGQFKKVQQAIATSLEKKGMSKEKAERIGGGVAYKQGVKKYGKKVMKLAAKQGKAASLVSYALKRHEKS